jgi:hypothetical protein
MATNDRLYNTRQKLYRLYDIEAMNENRINNLLSMYEMIKEYAIDLTNITLDRLNDIRSDIDNKIKSANDFNKRGMTIKRLDNILTLIAIVESNNKNALRKIMITNELIEEGLLKDNIKDNIVKKKEELEREIIDIKKEYYG